MTANRCPTVVQPEYRDNSSAEPQDHGIKFNDRITGGEGDSRLFVPDIDESISPIRLALRSSNRAVTAVGDLSVLV